MIKTIRKKILSLRLWLSSTESRYAASRRNRRIQPRCERSKGTPGGGTTSTQIRRGRVDLGTVLDHRVPKLHWTVAGDEQSADRFGRYPIVSSDRNLPEIFWVDLRGVLRLLALSYSYSAQLERWGGSVTKLDELTSKLRNLLSSSNITWNPMTVWQVRGILGMALVISGEISGDLQSFREAVVIYRDLTRQIDSQSCPGLWFEVRVQLGIALQSLGDLSAGEDLLLKSVDAYRDALRAVDREKMPKEWGITQNNLCNALHSLGGHSIAQGNARLGHTRLIEARQACLEALSVRPKDSVPLLWATTQLNLTGVQIDLGRGSLARGDEDEAELERAVEMAREAEAAVDRAVAPVLWIGTQLNLASALGALGQVRGDAAPLREGLRNIEEVSRSFETTSTPLYQARAESVRAVILGYLAEHERNAGLLCGAVTAFAEASCAFATAGASFPAEANLYNAKISLQLLSEVYGPQELSWCRKQIPKRCM